MECPDCGYVMSPFDKECPKCKRLGRPQDRARAGPNVPPPASPRQPAHSPPQLPPQPPAVPKAHPPPAPLRSSAKRMWRWIGGVAGYFGGAVLGRYLFFDNWLTAMAVGGTLGWVVGTVAGAEHVQQLERDEQFLGSIAQKKESDLTSAEKLRMDEIARRRSPTQKVTGRVSTGPSCCGCSCLIALVAGLALLAAGLAFARAVLQGGAP